MKTAVIMAAGLGTRFGRMTETVPKGFVECGGMSMVERSIQTLIACGIERIIIGTGYLKEKYDIEKVGIVDMFPFTYHVETVVCLERK